MITVDWDFFVPEKQEWDLGHDENDLFIKVLWEVGRTSLINKMRTNGLEKDFWKYIESWADLTHFDLFVTESHGNAAGIALDCDRINPHQIISFDTHHDCWPLSKVFESQKIVYCHDWFRSWFEFRKFEMYRGVWVRPGKKNLFKLDPPIDRLSQRVYNPEKPMAKCRVDTIHVCRSGAWTPPWLDHLFVRFVREIAKKAKTIQVLGGYEPMTPRWSKEKIREKRKESRYLEKLKRELIKEAKTRKVEINEILSINLSRSGM